MNRAKIQRTGLGDVPTRIAQQLAVQYNPGGIGWHSQHLHHKACNAIIVLNYSARGNQQTGLES